MTLQTLPIDKLLPEIRQQLSRHTNLVVSASPGSGKTTRLPPWLTKELPGRVIVLQPRRIAAVAAACRVANERGWALGTEVGYQVRFDRKADANTRLIYMTDALLLQQLLRDPTLRDIDTVIIDEIHERSATVDLLLGLLAELQQLNRPNLRIVAMSATLQADELSRFLGGCPIVSLNSSQYPIAESWWDLPLQISSNAAIDRTVACLKKILSGQLGSKGDILCFLPGAREINAVATQISGIRCDRLIGSLGVDEQNRIIQKSSERRIILATNVAETSITVDGVGTVIDCGLSRQTRASVLGFQKLTLARISQSSVIQRRGRAGRQMSGHCYYLWSKADHASFPAAQKPEILSSNLERETLTLKRLRINPSGFSWLTPPPADTIASAIATLQSYGFISPAGEISEDGVFASELPLEPALASLVVVARKHSQAELGCRLATVLSEDMLDLNHSRVAESDIDGLAEQSRLTQRAHRVEVDLMARVKNISAKMPAISLSELLALAFPRRIAKRRNAESAEFQLSDGSGAKLHKSSAVLISPFVVVLDLAQSGNDILITKAHGLAESLVRDLFKDQISEQSVARWDQEKSAVIKERCLFFHSLPVTKPERLPATHEEAFPLLVRHLEQSLGGHLHGSTEVVQFLTRWSFAKVNGATLPNPPRAADSLADVDSSLVENLRGYIEETSFATTRLIPADLSTLLRHLPKSLNHQVEALAPTTWVNAIGRPFAIDYTDAGGPCVRVRIQDAFGTRVHPKLAHGRVPLVFHLLAPNQRPAQITSDIERFWSGSYTEVRKELRGDYPKHPWPDDPANATPPLPRKR